MGLNLKLPESLNHLTPEEIEQLKAMLLNIDFNNHPNGVTIAFPITAKEFIKRVLIKEIGEVVKSHPWLGFVLISSGIEFLGKCIDTKNPTDWNKPGQSGPNFRDAINSLDAFSKYRDLLKRKDIDLYAELRCGLVHSFAPNSKGAIIGLSHGNKELPSKIDGTGNINFNADELYEDFKLACEFVIGQTYPNPNKMNEAKVFIQATIANPYL